MIVHAIQLDAGRNVYATGSVTEMRSLPSLSWSENLRTWRPLAIVPSGRAESSAAQHLLGKADRCKNQQQLKEVMDCSNFHGYDLYGAVCVPNRPRLPLK